MDEFISHKRALFQGAFPSDEGDKDWSIFEACEISVAEQRRRDGGGDRTLTYGELNFESLAELIYLIKFNLGGLKGGECNFHISTINHYFKDFKFVFLLILQEKFSTI
jgi:hypothetical protein